MFEISFEASAASNSSIYLLISIKYHTLLVCYLIKLHNDTVS